MIAMSYPAMGKALDLWEEIISILIEAVPKGSELSLSSPWRRHLASQPFPDVLADVFREPESQACRMRGQDEIGECHWQRKRRKRDVFDGAAQQ